MGDDVFGAIFCNRSAFAAKLASERRFIIRGRLLLVLDVLDGNALCDTYRQVGECGRVQ